MEDLEKIELGLRENLARKNYKSVKAIVADLLPADVFEIINDLNSTERVVVFRLLNKRVAAEVFTDLPIDQQSELLELLSEKQTTELFEELDPDDRADVLEEFPAGVVKQLLTLISPAEREMTARLLGYPENSAGRIMTPELVELRPTMTASEALEHIRLVGPNKEMIYICYVIGQYRKLRGAVSLREILFAPPGSKITDIMTKDPVCVSTQDDQEEVANIAVKYDLLAVPVVDAENRLVGIVTIDDLTDIIEEEVTEDVYRMAGIAELPESYFNTKTLVLFRRRFIWLVLLMVAQIFTGGILKHFESAMLSTVSLVFFIPMLMGTAGNAATQSATLVIRGLAIGEIDVRAIGRVLVRETGMGILLGLLLGAVGGLIALFLGGDVGRLYLAVSIAFMCTIFTANLVGAFLPLAFKRFGFDPAISSGPAITTVVDISGLVIYFLIAGSILNL